MASDWVQTEIAKARKREAQEKRQMLFPMALVPYDLSPDEAQRLRSVGTPGKAVTIKEWECFDADRGKIRRARYASISFPTSATGRTTIPIRRRFSGWWTI